MQLFLRSFLTHDVEFCGEDTGKFIYLFIHIFFPDGFHEGCICAGVAVQLNISIPVC